MFSDHFRALLAGEDLGTNYANKTIGGLWLDRESGSGGNFSMENGIKISAEFVKDRIKNKQNNADQVKTFFRRKATNIEPNPEFKNLLKLLEFFSNNTTLAQQAANNFSRITSVELSAINAHRYNTAWSPLLTLGVILKICSDKQDDNTGNPCKFLLCVQPRCDSVRLNGGVAFPFLKVKRHKKKKANLVFQDGNESYVLYVETKPSNLVMVEFLIPSDADRVLGEKSSSGDFIFEEKEGQKYQWIATLNPLKAQNIADSLGARTHSVGMDEFEWLRMQS